MIATYRQRQGTIRHFLLGLIGALTVGFSIAALVIMSSIARERERTIEAMAKLEEARDLHHASDANVARTQQVLAELELAKAQASMRAINSDIASKEASEEAERVRREAADYGRQLLDRDKQLLDEMQRRRWSLPQIVTAGVVAVVGNRVELDLGRDNLLRVGRVLNVYRRFGPETRLVDTISLTEINEARSFGLFIPANDVDWARPGDEASDY